MTSEFARRGLHVASFYFETRRPGIAQPGNGGQPRNQLVQQPQALWLQRTRRKTHAGDVAARPAEAGHETGCNRITAADKHDRYGRGGCPGCAHGNICAEDYGHVPLHQIRGECRKPIELVLRPAEFDRYVVAIDLSGFLQAIAECRHSVN